MPPGKKERTDPAYLREQGKREAQGKKVRKVTFCFHKLIPTPPGQSWDEWEKEGLLALLLKRIQFVDQHSCQEAIQKQYLKPYTKVDFPPDSAFRHPKHIPEVAWTVMHITNHSKEVVVGYIEDDIFYIVFLDKEHRFWPTTR